MAIAYAVYAEVKDFFMWLGPFFMVAGYFIVFYWSGAKYGEAHANRLVSIYHEEIPEHGSWDSKYQHRYGLICGLFAACVSSLPLWVVAYVYPVLSAEPTDPGEWVYLITITFWLLIPIGATWYWKRWYWKENFSGLEEGLRKFERFMQDRFEIHSSTGREVDITDLRRL